MRKSPAQTLSIAQPRRHRPFNRAVIFDTILPDLRASLSLSLRSVADAVGSTAQTIWAVERGAEVHLSLALRLASFYDRRLDQIWEERASRSKK